MALSRDRCICIRKVEYSETSQIVTLFARDHGILRLVAKGAHRRTKAGASRFDGGVDLLDTGQAVFSHAPERELSTLTDWHLTDGHLSLRKNLRALYLAQYAAELVSLLLEEHDAHPLLFDRVEHVLAALESPQIEEAFLAFELSLLREAGYLPQLARCVSCHRAPELPRGYFSPSQGGVVCMHCEMTAPDRIEIDPRLIRLVAQLSATDRLPRLTRHQTDPINHILAQHVQHVLSRPLRMTRWVLLDRRAPSGVSTVLHQPARL